MLLMLIIVFVLFPIATLLHELGHYITARLTGIKIIQIKMGIGNTILKLNDGPLRLEVRVLFFIGGSTSWECTTQSRPIQRMFIALNGPIANLLLAFLAFHYMHYVGLPLMEQTLHMFMLVNFWIAIGNLIPYKLNNRTSDGWLVVQNLSALMNRSSSHH
ncbi:site-2 protease family protein [Pseudalkalibacillus berkeleyi]|uniref:Site-2 protease family protein n=1 Tax=Pseudalkalibacillus berkeleyi TaxID=1069813 RepID=A0ABS9GZ42_9BACL|nr:site-2 protease family protein [Pseudalkalibacillus berkeleyi]MCF6136965.1 site-2 protease family protein [Pseudalkalibacillus berkeleyi]